MQHRYCPRSVTPLHRPYPLAAVAAAVMALVACTTPQPGTQPSRQQTPSSQPTQSSQVNQPAPQQAPGQPAAQSASNLAAFSTQLSGMNQVPPLPKSATAGTGRVDAVLDKTTRLLRWKLSYRGLTGAAVAGHFHGPATVAGSAAVALAFKGTVTSPMDGQATLTPAQMAELLAGRWYVNIHTRAFPGGEIRGQMVLRE